MPVDGSAWLQALTSSSFGHLNDVRIEPNHLIFRPRSGAQSRTDPRIEVAPVENLLAWDSEVQISYRTENKYEWLTSVFTHVVVRSLRCPIQNTKYIRDCGAQGKAVRKVVAHRDSAWLHTGHTSTRVQIRTATVIPSKCHSCGYSKIEVAGTGTQMVHAGCVQTTGKELNLAMCARKMPR
ncbi:hypothetical protein B0H10DRAFT_1943377 [Mycena sp. CBHHK59/15]|nr:hypothetical protein B0H10DRAFT_1943377 [Mycena sp. CBHHK59/15]